MQGSSAFTKVLLACLLSTASWAACAQDATPAGTGESGVIQGAPWRIDVPADWNGDLVVYQLVMPEEADAEKGMISTSSPIGRALLNKEEGDEISVTTPSGSRSFELVKVTTIHEEA